LLVIEMLPVTLPVDTGANCAVNVVFCPEGMVRGSERPLKLKPDPEALAAVIVTLAVPPFVRVIVCGALLPTATLPNATLAGLALSCACTPVPLRGMASGEDGALLVIEMLPVTLPVETGANCEVNVAFCPAGMVRGSERPLKLKPEPEAVAAVIVTLAVPPFVRVIVCGALLPTATLPNAALAGLALSCACTPVPLSGIDIGEPGALLVIETLPLALPLAAGENLAVKDVF